MKDLILRFRFLLLPLTTGLIIVLVTIFFVLPKIRMMMAMRGGLKLEKEKLARLTEKVAHLEGLDEYELTKKVAEVERALPSRKAVAAILIALSSISNESGASFVDFKVSPGELSLSDFEKVRFEATFEGELTNIKEILRKISRATPVMRVAAFSVKETKAILKIEGHFSAVPESLGKIDEPLPLISLSEEKTYQKIVELTRFERVLPEMPVGKEDLFSPLRY